MKYVKLLEPAFVGDRTRPVGTVLPFSDQVADKYVNSKKGEFAPFPPPAVEHAEAPAPPEKRQK